MTKHKLKLKRTREEEEQHRLRKERRREKRRKLEREAHDGTPSSSRGQRDGQGPSRKWASSDEEEMEYGPQPAGSSSYIPPPQDYNALKAEIEERMFREKMFDALGDDERLDSVEAQFNDFAQVPEWWRSSSSSSAKGKARAYDGDELLKLDPRYMDEEEYVEWIRAGMYRKTHAEEYAEQERKKAAKAARQAEEKARRAETARMEQVAAEERRTKKRARESRRLEYAREEYNARWVALVATTVPERFLGYDDIPWPIAAAYQSKADNRHRGEDRPPLTTAVEDLTSEGISSFLLPVVEPELAKKERKDRLREAILRFHPDKFEGRFMRRINENEKERVRESIGQISRVLNSLMTL